MSEVTAFIQMFGYPLQILPFGRAAGHFKDITALVAAKDPSTIPLAYTYREGDYATQVDIYILNWREWEEGHFPPPGAAEPRQNQPRQPSCHGNPPNFEPNSFSSSSSNGAPSEPTIDLSAWSPRSRHLTEITKMPKPQPKERRNTQTAPADQLQIVEYKNYRTFAATNPNPFSDFAQISRFLRTYLLPTPAPNPITIKILYSLRTVNNQSVSSGVAQGKDLHSLTYAGLIKGRSLNSVLDENEEILTSTRRSHLTLTYVTQSGHMDSAWADGPLQPITDVSSNPHLNYSQAHDRNIFPPPTIQGQFLSLSDASYDGPPIPQPLPELTGAIIDTQSNERDNPMANIKVSSQAVTKSDLLHLFTTSEDVAATSRSPSKKTNSRYKRKQIATRRSERLQAKERQGNKTTRPIKAAKTNLASIPFQLHSHETPLEIDAALQILQASGLHIDQKVQDMIHEAMQLDLTKAVSNDTPPGTPLHDHILPLELPGESLLL